MFLNLPKRRRPINILNTLRAVPEICNVYCATANSVQVVVGIYEQGRGILGVIDVSAPMGIEDEAHTQERRDFFRKIGYKL